MQLWGWQSVASKWRNWDHLDIRKAKASSSLNTLNIENNL